MRKLMAVLMIVAMLGGCVGINQFLCNPTPAQIEAANVGIAVSQSILSGGAYYSGSDVMGAISALALPTFQMVIAGYCVTQAAWNSATQAVVAANTQASAQGGTTKALKMVGPYDAQITTLQSVKW